MSSGIAKREGDNGISRRQAAREFRAAERKLRKAARIYAGWAMNIDSSEDHEGADSAADSLAEAAIDFSLAAARYADVAA